MANQIDVITATKTITCRNKNFQINGSRPSLI
jgi:hypothetical protein